MDVINTMTMIEAIQEYQVPGATGDFDPATDKIDHGWVGHSPGTINLPIGRILPGMPTGFNRIGPLGHIQPSSLYPRFMLIYESWEDKERSWAYDKFNIPCWKHLDRHGNTLVRGLSPRNNVPFIHVILGNHVDKIACLELTQSDIEDMD